MIMDAMNDGRIRVLCLPRRKRGGPSDQDNPFFFRL